MFTVVANIACIATANAKERYEIERDIRMLMPDIQVHVCLSLCACKCVCDLQISNAHTCYLFYELVAVAVAAARSQLGGRFVSIDKAAKVLKAA